MAFQDADRPQVLENYRTLVSSFCEFLTVAIHTILYERDIYPQASFLKARKYDCSVRQSRHPKVCKWILDAVKAVEREMLKGSVAQTSLIIYSPSSAIPLERFVFSTVSFPVIPISEILTPFEGALSLAAEIENENETDSPSPPPSPSPKHNFQPPPRGQDATRPPSPRRLSSNIQPISLADLTAQFAAVLTRLCTLSNRLMPLPSNHDCTYTLAIELRDRVFAKDVNSTLNRVPRHPKPWLPSDVGLQPKPMVQPGSDPTVLQSSGIAENAALGGTSDRGKHLGGARTTPVRKVDAGPFLMEVWVEEGKEKLAGVGVGVRKSLSGPSGGAGLAGAASKDSLSHPEVKLAESGGNEKEKRRIGGSEAKPDGAESPMGDMKMDLQAFVVDEGEMEEYDEYGEGSANLYEGGKSAFQAVHDDFVS